MLSVDGSGLPLSIDVDSARPGEVTLIEPLLEQSVVARLPNRLIYRRVRPTQQCALSIGHHIPVSRQADHFLRPSLGPFSAVFRLFF